MFNQQSRENRNGHLLKQKLGDAYLDFMLSRQAMLCKESTLEFYKFTTGKFVEWLDVDTPLEITNKHVRAYLAELASRNLSDTTIHCHSRAIRTFVKFLHAEKYIEEPITFPMPSLSAKRLPVLSIEDVHQAVKGCTNLRDKAIILLMIDSGIRRKEVCDLTWSDVNLMNGVIGIANGKGGNSRSVVIGVTTRRVLLAYRRLITHDDDSPLFQTVHGNRLKPMGLRSIFVRLSKRTGVHITPHSLRRSFATLSLKAGMNLLHLQGLLGHASLEMTRHYVQMLDDDLVEAHRSHGPIDTFLNK